MNLADEIDLLDEPELADLLANYRAAKRRRARFIRSLLPYLASLAFFVVMAVSVWQMVRG